MREAQRKRAIAPGANSNLAFNSESAVNHGKVQPRVDLTAAQASVQAAGQKAGAYIASWGAWASERRKGWAEGQVSSCTNGDLGVEQTREKSHGKLVRWNSTTGGKVGGGGKMKEEMGGDGIGRLDA